MLLLINSSGGGTATVALADGERVVARHTGPSRVRERDTMVGTVSRLVRRRRGLAAVRGIGVVAGPGPFSALRAGIATANALGFALGVPVVGISAADAPTLEAFAAIAAEQFRGARTGAFVAPEYGAEPHITLKREA